MTLTQLLTDTSAESFVRMFMWTPVHPSHWKSSNNKWTNGTDKSPEVSVHLDVWGLCLNLLNKQSTAAIYKTSRPAPRPVQAGCKKPPQPRHFFNRLTSLAGVFLSLLSLPLPAVSLPTCWVHTSLHSTSRLQTCCAWSRNIGVTLNVVSQETNCVTPVVLICVETERNAQTAMSWLSLFVTRPIVHPFYLKDKSCGETSSQELVQVKERFWIKDRDLGAKWGF